MSDAKPGPKTADEGAEWRPVFRLIHAGGGIRVACPPGPVATVYPAELVTRKSARPTIASYGALFDTISRLGWPVIGAEFTMHAMQLDGRAPPEWRIYTPRQSANKAWVNEDAAQLWSQIANAAYGAKAGHLWDLARRISYQLRVCAWRLHQLSDAYWNQLNAQTTKGATFEVGHLFEDGYTKLGYLAVQAALTDACVLRDYLAEFVAFVYGLTSTTGSRITRMGTLKKPLEQLLPRDTLTSDLLQACAGDGWLAVLGHYRDLVAHSAPLANADRKLMAMRVTRPLPGGKQIPAVFFPIPENPGEIMARRNKGDMFADFELLFSRFLAAAKGDIPRVDALEYMHSTTCALSALAFALVDKSPLRPEPLVITEKHILSFRESHGP